jgi:hypothetical protein
MTYIEDDAMAFAYRTIVNSIRMYDREQRIGDLPCGSVLLKQSTRERKVPDSCGHPLQASSLSIPVLMPLL